MIILPIHAEILVYLKQHKLLRKFKKQCDFFVTDPKHPSLNTEILEPKQLKIFSFRVDKKYRAIFIFRGPDIVEVVDVNNHYK